VLPVRFVVGEHLADRLVALGVTTERLQRIADRLLDGWNVERLGELQAEIGGAAAHIALREPQAEHVLCSKTVHRQRGGDTGVDAARNGHHRPLPSETANGIRSALCESLDALRRIEGDSRGRLLSAPRGTHVELGC
jgi:hypothetical protein